MRNKLYTTITLLTLLSSPLYAKALKFGSPNLPPGVCSSEKCMAGSLFINSIKEYQHTVSFTEMPFIRIVISILLTGDIDVTAITLPLSIPGKFIEKFVLSKLDVIKPAFFHMPFAYLSYKKQIDPNNLKGLTAVAIKGSASAEKVKKMGNKIIEVSAGKQIMQLLKNKRADFAPVALIISKYILSQTFPGQENDFHYKIYEYKPAHFAFRKGVLNPDELKQISDNIKKIKSTEKDRKIFNQTIKNHQMPPIEWLDTFSSGKTQIMQ